MNLIPVNSSFIAAVGYDRGFLFVVFHRSETVYEHPGVPYSLFVALLHADSVEPFTIATSAGRYK